MYLLLAFNFKFMAGISYLKVFKPTKMNSSSSTSSLFWFRFNYDVFFFYFILFIIKKEVLPDSWIENNLNLNDQLFTKFIQIPLFISWFAFYELSVQPAYARVCFQRYSQWLPGDKLTNPHEEKKQKLDKFMDL